MVRPAHVDLQDASLQPGDPMSCVTALIKFLDHRNTSGVVCSEVTGVECVYQLQSVSSPRLQRAFPRPRRPEPRELALYQPRLHLHP